MRCASPSATAQPRVRGERVWMVIDPGATFGSAPRARGTVAEVQPGPRRRRLSPACAGNGRARACAAPPTTAQPRVRGERPTGWWWNGTPTGSAPRARGTGLALAGGDLRTRLSPACAGNGRPPHAARGPVPAQPRVRGERGTPTLENQYAAGSAPRARGTARSPLRGHRPGRLSPRVRGERVSDALAKDDDGGSAPGARGTADLPAPRPRQERLSPACAGNGVPATTCTRATPAQPRVRGERAQEQVNIVIHAGSAPRARGTAAGDPQPRPVRRLSPACAGNGVQMVSPAIAEPAQPRVRGERSARREL